MMGEQINLGVNMSGSGAQPPYYPNVYPASKHPTGPQGPQGAVGASYYPFTPFGTPGPVGPQGGLYAPFAPDPIGVDARKRKITQAIEKAIGLLSLSICAHITGLYFDGDEPKDYRFVVAFDNGKQLEFTDIDQFPTQADIGRIALMCPY